MADDDAKKAILARRARFIAAAMMGAGLVSCEKKSPERFYGGPTPGDTPPAAADPNVCLNMAPAPETVPAPCLSAPLPADGTSDTVDAGANDAGPSPVPAPCLSPRPRSCLSYYDSDPYPRPCLSAPKRPKPTVCLTY
jgi:hypothetical protein